MSRNRNFEDGSVAPQPEAPVANPVIRTVSIVLPALIATIVLAVWRPFLEAALVGMWLAMTLIVIRSDVERFIIPDWASLTIAGLGCAHAGLTAPPATHTLDIAIACALRAMPASALLYIIAIIYRRLRRQDGLGMGDVKLAGACAIWLSPAAQAAALEFAALSGIGLVVLARIRRPLDATKNLRLPFGALLAPAALMVFLVVQPR